TLLNLYVRRSMASASTTQSRANRKANVGPRRLVAFVHGNPLVGTALERGFSVLWSGQRGVERLLWRSRAQRKRITRPGGRHDENVLSGAQWHPRTGVWCDFGAHLPA